MNTTTTYTTPQWETTKLASPGYAPKFGIYDEPGDLLAVVSGDSPEEVEGRAKLISAAPDLLAALQKCLEWLEAIPRTDDKENAQPDNFGLRVAREAIAKATN